MSIKNPHNVISAYFIGPKSENMPEFRANITAILDKIEEARSRYQPDDGVCSFNVMTHSTGRETDTARSLSVKMFESPRSSCELPATFNKQ